MKINDAPQPEEGNTEPELACNLHDEIANIITTYSKNGGISNYTPEAADYLLTDQVDPRHIHHRGYVEGADAFAEALEADNFGIEFSSYKAVEVIGYLLEITYLLQELENLKYDEDESDLEDEDEDAETEKQDYGIDDESDISIKLTKKLGDDEYLLEVCEEIVTILEDMIGFSKLDFIASDPYLKNFIESLPAKSYYLASLTRDYTDRINKILSQGKKVKVGSKIVDPKDSILVDIDTEFEPELSFLQNIYVGEENRGTVRMRIFATGPYLRIIIHESSSEEKDGIYEVCEKSWSISIPPDFAEVLINQTTLNSAENRIEGDDCFVLKLNAENKYELVKIEPGRFKKNDDNDLGDSDDGVTETK